MTRDFTSLKLVEALELIRSRDLTCSELLEHNLDRLMATEPVLGAFVEYDVQGARERAARLDERITAGDWPGPLTGATVGVKDLFHTTAFPTRAGSRAYLQPAGGPNAESVDRLVANGAIIIGKTTTHEFATGLGDPRTGNAWDPDRYPGGSSAGSAVAVAAGSAVAALGTDSGGSIRQPAALNGVVGYKPTRGLISETGVVPLTRTMDTVGLITRVVADCSQLLDVLSQRGEGHELADRPVRVGLALPTDEFTDSRVADVLARAVGAVSSSSTLDTVEVRFADHLRGTAIGMTLIQSEAAEIHRERLERRGDLYGPAVRAFLDGGRKIPQQRLDLARQARRELQLEVDRLFNSNRIDILITPTVTVSPPLLDEFDPSRDLGPLLDYTVVANLTGQPAITVPCRVGDSGLPVGIQMLGRPNHDHGLLRAAAAVEQVVSPPYREASAWKPTERRRDG